MKLLLFALLAAIAFAQDQPAKDQPIKFRGAYIGEPVSDFVDCSTKKPTSSKEGFKVHGKPCDGRKGMIRHVKVHGMLNPKDNGEIFYIENQKVAEIKVLIGNDDWDKIRYDLTEKLGNPLSEAPEVYQNGFGARWEFNQGFWVKGDIVAAAGIKVLTTPGGSPVREPWSDRIATQGIEVRIMSAERAKLPNTQPNSLD
jgi:hypothetical protein